MIFVTPNPALDRTLILPQVVLGEVHRVSRSMLAAGGKGLNAARAVRVLGGRPHCMGLVGGASGKIFSDLAQAEGFQATWTAIAGETRTCIILVEEAGGEPTVLNEPGPTVSAREWENFIEMIANAARSAHLCFNGSLPSGISPEAYRAAIRQLQQAGQRVWIDSSGPALRAALEAAPTGIKVNALEAGAAVGYPLHTLTEVAQAARAIRDRGVEAIIVTLGQQGAVLATHAATWHAIPPPIKPVSNVGSGDVFFGALMLALEQGAAAPEALRHGVAAGAANTLQPGGGVFSRAQFDELLRGTVVSKVDF